MGTPIDKKYAHLPLVPESVLKKRHDLDDLARKRAAARALQPNRRSKRGGANNDGTTKKKAFYVKKPETIVARARSRRNNAARFHRVMKKGMQKRASNKPIYAEKKIEDDDDDDDDEKDNTAEKMKEEEEKETTERKANTIKYQKNSFGAKLVFVVRIRDHVGTPRCVRETLKAMRLEHIHDGVFLPYTEKTRKTLHLVEPWVVYGPPSKAVVADLIERRGYARVDNKRVPLSDNIVIEEALGDEGLLCKEDLVHEIYNVGSVFEKAVLFLWPFKLTDNKTKFERLTLKLKDGKDYGDRGEAITEYVQQVL